MLGPALETLDALLGQDAAPFDLCFIDADKRAYGEYFSRAMELVRIGGLIAVDNTLCVRAPRPRSQASLHRADFERRWYGRTADPAVDDKQTVAIREFNARVLAGEQRQEFVRELADARFVR
jgi:predicted O-methyltransferase YrrM